MRIKLSTIEKSVLIVLFAMNLGLTKPLGLFSPYLTDSLYISIVTGVVSLFFFVCYCLSGRISLVWRQGFLPVFLCYLVLLLTGYLRTAMDLGANTALIRALPYFPALLFLPLFFLLQTGCWPLRDFLRLLVAMTLISYGIRIAICLSESLTGVILFPEIALESASSGWYRNGVLRINPPCLGNIFVPLALYMAVSARGMRERLLYCSAVLTAVLYSALIHSARSQLIYQLAEIALMLLYLRRSSFRRLLLWLSVLAGLIGFMLSDYGQSLLASFSPSDSRLGLSTQYRLWALAYYGQKLLNSPLTGTGFLLGSQFEYSRFTRDANYSVTGTLWDLGILQTIVQTGVLSVLFYLSAIVKGIRLSFLLRRRTDTDLGALIFGLTLSQTLTAVNFDWFSSLFTFSLPVFLSLLGYAGCCEREKPDKTDKECP